MKFNYTLIWMKNGHPTSKTVKTRQDFGKSHPETLSDEAGQKNSREAHQFLRPTAGTAVASHDCRSGVLSR
jgi:hypothetical protein